MPSVRVLPAALVSQIAAGEVVERPASALKELLENSLDADATRCDVELEGGGITRLLVRDDGHGMSERDARLCLERHATSKIEVFDDLVRVRSYGFRGEALPTIASVSRFSLRTRSKDDDAGVEISVTGGADPVVEPIGTPVGTTIELRDLFFNVPARRKFLRSSATEAGHASDVVDNAALARPDVTFTFSRDGRITRRWLRAADRAERVRAMFGDEALSQILGERGPLKVEAYLSRPERATAGATSLKLFVNGRHVKDRALLSTIAQAYGSILERGRYPRGVVYVDLPTQLVDVNVHPQKTEVRFADPRAVCDAVYHVLSATLAQAFARPVSASDAGVDKRTPAAARSAAGDLSNAVPSAPTLGSARANSWLTKGAAPPAGAPRDATPAAPPVSSRTAMFSFASSTLAKESANPRESANPSCSSDSTIGSPSEASDVTAASESVSRRYEPEDPGRAEATWPIADSVRKIAPSEHTTWQSLRFVAQLRETYLLCEGEDAIFIIDQHAAAERVTFDRLRKQYKNRAVSAQSLLFPLLLDVSPDELELVAERKDVFAGLGLVLEPRGERQLSVHAIPKLLLRASPERLVRDLLSECLQQGGRAFSDAIDLRLATMACHGSLRSGDRVSAEEAQALLRALDQADFAGHCPHGRPIVSRISYNELERKVGRR